MCVKLYIRRFVSVLFSFSFTSHSLHLHRLPSNFATMPWTVEDLKALFAKYAGADNAMTKEEFLNLAKTEFPDAGITTMEEADDFMGELDDNGDGTLTFKEVKNLLKPLCMTYQPK